MCLSVALGTLGIFCNKDPTIFSEPSGRSVKPASEPIIWTSVDVDGGGSSHRQPCLVLAGQTSCELQAALGQLLGVSLLFLRLSSPYIPNGELDVILSPDAVLTKWGSRF